MTGGGITDLPRFLAWVTEHHSETWEKGKLAASWTAKALIFSPTQWALSRGHQALESCNSYMAAASGRLAKTRLLGPALALLIQFWGET